MEEEKNVYLTSLLHLARSLASLNPAPPDKVLLPICLYQDFSSYVVGLLLYTQLAVCIDNDEGVLTRLADCSAIYRI